MGLDVDPDTEIPVLDPLTRGPLSKDDVVRLSDRHCYAKETMRQWVQSGAFQQNGRSDLPFTRGPMTDDDYRAIGLEPPRPPPTAAEVREAAIREEAAREEAIRRFMAIQDAQDRGIRDRIRQRYEERSNTVPWKEKKELDRRFEENPSAEFVRTVLDRFGPEGTAMLINDWIHNRVQEFSERQRGYLDTLLNMRDPRLLHRVQLPFAYDSADIKPDEVAFDWVDYLPLWSASVVLYDSPETDENPMDHAQENFVNLLGLSRSRHAKIHLDQMIRRDNPQNIAETLLTRINHQLEQMRLDGF